MAILDLFSKRNKPLPDVYTYNDLPEGLRNQIVHIMRDTMGPNFGSPYAGVSWQSIANGIAKEHHMLAIPGKHAGWSDDTSFFGDCLTYVLDAKTDRALDMVELCFRYLVNSKGVPHFLRLGDVDSAVEDLNHRFREHGCGYQFESGKIVRVDSQLVHADVVRPALHLLSAKGFEGPEKEFLTAHELFRHGKIEPAITEACKAFESTMKAICDAKKWQYDSKKATASQLISIVIEKGLVPGYSKEQLDTVAKCLIGSATVRNKDSGHGAGAKPRDLPEHFASYALHLAASNIVFLIECYRAKK